MKIGVVSDTHGFFDPRLAELLGGVELILHAGDVGKPEVLEELERIAPVRAVKGNVDSTLTALPLSLTLTLGGTTWRDASQDGSSLDTVQLEMLHGLPAAQTDLEEWANLARTEAPAPPERDELLREFDQNTGVVIFGHSHLPCAVTLCGRLFFNPGSAGKQRFSRPRCCGLLDLTANRLEATILSLQPYHGKLPEKVLIELGRGAASHPQKGM